MVDVSKRIKEALPAFFGPLTLQEDLARERNQLRSLIDNLPDYIYFKDTQSRFIDANQATVSIMRCKSREELIGKTDFEFYPKEFAQKFFQDEQDILQTGKSKVDIEEDIIDERQNKRILSTSKIVLKDAEGKVVGLVGIGRDITDRKRVEEILKRDNELFEKIIKERTKELLEVQAEFDRAKRLSDIGTLAAMVAHELRNPLGVVSMTIQRMKKDAGSKDLELLTKVQAKLSEGEQIIDNLLTYSRLKNPFYETVELGPLLDECVSNTLVRFPGYEVHIDTQYDKNITTIDLDPLQIKEVFINLLNNAVQAFAGQSGKIMVTTHDLGKEVKVSFKDNGTGISAEDLDKIFIPFFTRKSRGTGLGLTVCKEIIEMHGGTIEVQSRKGEGTQFDIFLPLKKSA